MPLAGRDVISSQRTSLQTLFQSTRPARGATRYSALRHVPTHHFNPRAPRGARLATSVEVLATKQISIHAPREGRDLQTNKVVNATKISIHAPREGRDGCQYVMRPYQGHFNPRAPRGARLGKIKVA